MIFIFLLVVEFAWFVFAKIKKLPFGKGNRTVILTSLFIFQIPILKENLLSFECLDFGNGSSYLKEDYQLECWTGSHSGVLAIAAVSTIIWMFIIPAIFFHKLKKNKKNLEDLKIM